MITPLNREPFRVIIQERDEIFQKGRRYPVAIFDDQGEYVNLTFPDGTELYGLKKELFEVVEKTA